MRGRGPSRSVFRAKSVERGMRGCAGTLAIIVSPVITSVNNHACCRRRQTVADPGEDRRDPADALGDAVTLLQHTAEADQGVWQSALPLRDRPCCAPRTVLRVESSEGGEAPPPDFVARTSRADAPGDRQSPQSEEAFASLGGSDPASDRPQRS